MDFLDSFTIDSPRKKFKKVRSWYLYEQYKSLEKNQLDAALRLKNKSYQDRLLRQELSERRARRSLCDQIERCQSESKIDKHINTTQQAPMSISDDDLFESLCEFHEEYELEAEDDYSQYSQTSKNYDEKATESKKLDEESVGEDNIEQFLEDDNDQILENDIKEELSLVKQNIAETIALQLDTVQENIACLEKYAKYGDDKISDVTVCDQSEVDDLSSVRSVVLKKIDKKSENCVLLIWSKFVSFAHKFIQMHTGNCYYDCSSQFLTAVLVCDVLRRGVSTMCHLLQPYASPIKYVASESDENSDSCESVTRKNITNKKYYNINNAKYNRCKSMRNRKKLRSLGRKYQSEDLWDGRSSFDNCLNKIHRKSEPWRSNVRFFEKESVKSSRRAESFRNCKLSQDNVCRCCLKRAVNPMLQIAHYIDSILQDIEQ